MGANLPTVSAKIDGDASGLTAALKNAEVQTGLSAAKIDASVGQLVTRLEHRFSLAHLGTDLLRGLGIGSGFHLAEKSAELIAAWWKEASESAKRITDESQNQLDLVLAGIKARSDDSQQLAALKTQERHLRDEMAALNGPHTQIVQQGVGMGMTRDVVISREQTDIERERIAAIGVELQKVGNEEDAVQRKIKKAMDDAATSIKGATKGGVDYNAIKEVTIADENLGIVAVREMNAELEKEAEKYRDLGDPLKAYRDTLKEINRLEEEGKLTGMEAALARAGNLKNHGLLTPNRAMMDEESMAGADEAIDKTLNKTKDLNSLARDLGMTFSSAFEDAVVSGKSLGDVLQGLEQDLIRIALRKIIIEPLLNSLGGALGGSSSGGGGWANFLDGKADGGDVGGGQSYLVGEQGPEVFKPNVGGSIIPNGGMKAGGGTVYNIDARGADRTGLQRLESMIRATRAMIKPTSLAAATDARRRVAA